MTQLPQELIDQAKELMCEFNVLTAGEGDWADGGEFANRFPQDVRRSDVNGWLVEAVAQALFQAREKAREESRAETLTALKVTGNPKDALCALMGKDEWLEHGKTFGWLNDVRLSSVQECVRAVEDAKYGTDALTRLAFNRILAVLKSIEARMREGK